MAKDLSKKRKHNQGRGFNILGDHSETTPKTRPLNEQRVALLKKIAVEKRKLNRLLTMHGIRTPDVERKILRCREIITKDANIVEMIDLKVDPKTGRGTNFNRQEGARRKHHAPIRPGKIVYVDDLIAEKWATKKDAETVAKAESRKRLLVIGDPTKP